MKLYDEVIARLQTNGERLTMQRRLVIEVLCNHTEHLSITEIARYLTPATMLPETTIYRILQWLKALEIVSQTDMGIVGTVYQLLVKPHHHLICLSCGSVTDFDNHYMDTLREQLTTDFGFKARIDHMAIYGYCQNCQNGVSQYRS